MKKLSKGTRKHIRREKTKIRKSFINEADKKELINGIYKKYNDHKRNISVGDKKGN